MSLYILDSGFFIDPYSKYLHPKIAPTYWEQLAPKLKEMTNVYTLKVVRREIEEQSDWLLSWFKRNFDKARILDEARFSKERELLNRYVEREVSRGEYKKSALKEFIKPNKADAHVVACALYYKNNGLDPIVVSSEINVRNKRKVPIPKLCREFSINHIHVMNFIIALDIQL